MFINELKYRYSLARYEWHDGFRSVQMSPDVSLPQFVVIGHRQRQIEVSLSSGNYSRLLADVQVEYCNKSDDILKTLPFSLQGQWGTT